MLFKLTIYDIFNESNIKIPQNIAGLMASAIISDTLLLSSPTTTMRDTDALIELSKIAEIDYKEYGKRMLKQGMSIKGLTNEQILNKDFKTFKVNDDLDDIDDLTYKIYDDAEGEVAAMAARMKAEAEDSFISDVKDFAEGIGDAVEDVIEAVEEKVATFTDMMDDEACKRAQDIAEKLFAFYQSLEVEDI